MFLCHVEAAVLFCLLDPLFITSRAISEKFPGKCFFFFFSPSLCLLLVNQPRLEYTDFKGGSWGRKGMQTSSPSDSRLESYRTGKKISDSTRLIPNPFHVKLWFSGPAYRCMLEKQVLG